MWHRHSEHPQADIIEPDELGYAAMLTMIAPYLGKLGVYSDWTPLQDRGWLFPEDVMEAIPGGSRISACFRSRINKIDSWKCD